MRQLRFLLVPFSLLLLGGCGGGNITQGGGPIKSEPLPTDSVSGTVTFKGSPLAGVSVTAFVTNTNSVYQVTTTDTNGAYQFTGMQAYGNVPTDYQIWASKPGYGFYPSVGSGGKVTRADYTGQFQGNGVTDIAIYFTVIDYVALPNRSLSGDNFAAYDGSNPLVRLPASGQQASYAGGDDGAEQKGVGPRHSASPIIRTEPSPIPSPFGLVERRRLSHSGDLVWRAHRSRSSGQRGLRSHGWIERR